MKTAKSGEYLLWDGKLAHVIGEIDRHAVLIEIIEGSKCEKCGHVTRDVFTVIDSSPLFQSNAEPIKTINDD